MAKTSKEQIVKDERKILNELQKNARENIDTISNKCNFSRQKVWRIINRLEEDKTIWGYTSIVDDEKIDIKRYIILIRRSTEPIDDAISKIIDLTLHKKGEEIGVNVECSSYLHGRFDWMLVITAKDLQSIKKFSHILEKEYYNVISEVQIMEDIFSVKKCGIVNPNLDRLKEFV
jgi:DNA-binding Lrp family transcriptional regulator